MNSELPENTGTLIVRQLLTSLQLLSEEEINDFCKLLKPVTLKKGDYFIREGEISKEVAFIHSGILRSFYWKENGEELTYCLTFSNNFMTAYSSFITGEPANENIQALSDCEMLVLQKSIIPELEKNSQNWTKFLKMIAEQQYLELEKRVFSLQKDSAAKRYSRLLKSHPDYLQEVSLQHLASYLNITPRHLSRIRKELEK